MKSTTESVAENLTINKWIRHGYSDNIFSDSFVEYANKAEFEFFSNGSLIIIEPENNNTSSSEFPPPPVGFSDTLLIYCKWNYNESYKSLTIKVDDTVQHNYDISEYINWKLSYINNNQFEIENSEEKNSSTIAKELFKRKS
ncbi:hypothetical protein [Yeosuana marina]|uniref:hypothetical protein n=1 Tax=Yeosuana marina TaxID=1565536 RepID=UPI0030C882E5